MDWASFFFWGPRVGFEPGRANSRMGDPGGLRSRLPVSERQPTGYMSRSVNPKRVPLWSRPMARDKRCGRQGHQDRGDRGQYAPRQWPVWPVAISAVVVAGALAGGIYLGLLALAASRPGPNGGPASIDLLDIIKTTITVRVRRRRPRRRLRLPQAATRRGRRTPSRRRAIRPAVHDSHRPAWARKTRCPPRWCLRHGPTCR
ncbi:MAG: hypothetical protein JWM45_475 [Pseudonocardiales bacterium]|nr:hypothetical protein [Pseudonocardiales bacterium]